MTPTKATLRLSSTLAADLAADWQATLDDAPSEAVRAGLLADSALYAAFNLGWRACAKRFINRAKESTR